MTKIDRTIKRNVERLQRELDKVRREDHATDEQYRLARVLAMLDTLGGIPK